MIHFHALLVSLVKRPDVLLNVVSVEDAAEAVVWKEIAVVFANTRVGHRLVLRGLLALKVKLLVILDKTKQLAFVFHL